MDIIKLIAIIFGATGFWKIIEIILNIRIDKKLKNAETSNLYAQANSQIVENWVEWSQRLEKRVGELEGNNTEMKLTITKQRKRISELEKHVVNLEERNKELTNKLELLKKENYGNR
jgi:predicted RNase H-like nuclease (RuvC/YqgF family)